MGDDDARLLAFLHEDVEGLLDLVLALSIECAGCLIQENDLRLSHDSPSDGNSLLLATRQFESSFTDQSIEALWEECLVLNESEGVS